MADFRSNFCLSQPITTKMSENNWSNLLKNTKVKDLVKGKPITCDYYQPLIEVLEVLRKNNILSVPVLKKVEHAWSPMGFLDVLDIAAYIVRLSRQWNKTWNEEELIFVDRTFRTAKTLEVMDSLEDVVKKMTKDKRVYWRFHRFGVHDEKDRLVGIISQSDVNKLASEHLDIFPLRNKSVKDLNLIRGCLMMKENDSLGDVIEVLASNRVYGIALINQQGQLVGNFSASDLRGLSTEVFSKFHEPVMNFLKNKGINNTPIANSPDCKLGDCIRTLAEKRVHRLFLVDTENHPVGVISLSDIIPLLAQRDAPQSV